MRTSPDGVRLITDFEGCSLTLYNDPAGHCTIGYGHLVHLGNCDGRGNEEAFAHGIPQALATRLMQLDLASFEVSVNRLVKAPVTQHQFDALVSFAYNVGAGGLAISSVLKMVNQQRYAAAAAELANYVYGVGVLWPLPGLVRRRAAEAALFNTPDLTTEEEEMLKDQVYNAGTYMFLASDMYNTFPPNAVLCKQVIDLIGDGDTIPVSSRRQAFGLLTYAAAEALRGNEPNVTAKQQLRYLCTRRPQLP